MSGGTSIAARLVTVVIARAAVTVLLSFLFGTLRAESGDLSPMQTMIESLAQAEWVKTGQQAQGLAPALSWTLRLSAPIPDAWPVSADTTVSRYVYAAALDLEHLKDGERVAAPWGRIDSSLRAPESLRFVRLKPGLEILGTQGVRPLTAAESARSPADLPDRLQRALLALAQPAQPNGTLASETMDSYRLWARLNGVVAAAILERHPAFQKVLRSP